MKTIADVSLAAEPPWYRTLNRDQWYTLFAANLGWAFDGYETYALILTAALAFRELLPAGQHQAIPFYAGLTIAVTLLGWGIGGIGGGIVSDYIGRKRTLVYAILAYSFVTGFSALAWSWASFVAFRFIVGIARANGGITRTERALLFDEVKDIRREGRLNLNRAYSRGQPERRETVDVELQLLKGLLVSLTVITRQRRGFRGPPAAGW